MRSMQTSDDKWCIIANAFVPLQASLVFYIHYYKINSWRELSIYTHTHTYSYSYAHITLIIFIVAFIITTSNSNDKWILRLKNRSKCHCLDKPHTNANERHIMEGRYYKVHWHIQQDTITTNAAQVGNSTLSLWCCYRARTLECTSKWPECD